MKIRVGDTKFNTRKVRRDLIRQIVGFQNLSSNPEFQKDIKEIRASLAKTIIFRKGLAYIQKNWDASFKYEVTENKRLLFKELKKDYGYWPSFKVKRIPKFDHRFQSIMTQLKVGCQIHGYFFYLTKKWHIRLGDATAIVHGNDYPPYFCKGHDFITNQGLAIYSGNDCANKKKILKARKRPAPKRPWWESRIKDKTLEKLIWRKTLKGEGAAAILKKLPVEMETGYEAVKQIIRRKRKRTGTITAKKIVP